jgi:choloylglycine hydrolase
MIRCETPMEPQAMKHLFRRAGAAILAAALAIAGPATACTGISLRASDGSVVVARTVEWALSDAAHDRLMVFPRRHAFVGTTPDGLTGMRWEGRHGFVTMTAYGQPFGPDGMNEAGLYVGMYYLPGFAEYAPHVRTETARALSVGDFMQWMLSSFATVEEVRARLDDVRVVHVDDPRFGGAALPFHWKVADPSGRSIVIEIVEGGTVKIYDAFLGVITNAPTYDWHLLNLRNYVGLDPAPRAGVTIGEVDLRPFGAGSGMIGLPGDFSPPSRFVRAAALTATARPLGGAQDAVFEAFRILDSFNIPLGAIAPAGRTATDIEGATQITSVSDLANRVYYFHTMHNRQVRAIDLRKIDFERIRPQTIEDELARARNVRELRPRD